MTKQMNLLNSFHASARGNSETAFGADASSRFLQMRPLATTQRQRLKRMHHLDFFKCVRLRQLKDSLRSGRIFSGSLYASARGTSDTAFRADATSQLLHIRPPRYPVEQPICPEPISSTLEKMLPACQPDYNLPLVSCRLIFPGMRS